MKKLKEKMIQWSRDEEIFGKISVFFVLIVFWGLMCGFIKSDIQCLCLGIIMGVQGIFLSMLECISGHNKEFVQKNSIWNVVLADEQVISAFTLLLLMISIILFYFVSKIFLLLIIIIVFIWIFAVQKITDFFKKRLIE